MKTYRHSLVNIIHPSQSLGGFDDSYCLDRNRVAEAFTLSVDDTWCKYVSTHAMLFAFLNNSTVGIYSLRTFGQ